MRRKSPANTLIGACSSDPQMPGADAHQGALCAPALGPINKADDLAILGVSDGFPPGQVGLVVAVLTGAHDEPDQLRLGRESLTVAGGVAEQESGQLCLGVERPMLGETVVEDQDVVHGALPLLHGWRQSMTLGLAAAKSSEGSQLTPGRSPGRSS